MKTKSQPQSRHTRSPLPPPTHEQITQRAHRLWLEAGRPEGQAREHWLEAERQLSGGHANESSAEVEADKRVDGLGPESRGPRTPSGENL